MTSPAEIDKFIESLLGLSSDACVEWPFGKDDDGYGMSKRLGYSRATHVVLTWRHV